MTVKFAADVIETFDTVKTLGTLNFLEAIPLCTGKTMWKKELVKKSVVKQIRLIM